MQWLEALAVKIHRCSKEVLARYGQIWVLHGEGRGSGCECVYDAKRPSESIEIDLMNIRLN